MGACFVTNPSSFQEVVQQPAWVDVLVEGYDSIVRKNVWDVVLRPKDKSAVKVVAGSVEKHKAIFVARGFSQVEGIDYDETFSSAARIVNYFIGLGFTKSEADVNLYHIVVEGKLLIIVIYVDDVIVTGDEMLIKYYKEGLSRELEMKDIGLMHYFPGMDIWQGDGDFFVSQGKYANELLRRFCMERIKPMEIPLDGNWRKEDATLGEVMDATVYRQLVGSLMYLGRTQPNMCYEVNQLSRAMVRPTKLYWDTS
eukprot:PITA_16908